MRLQDYLQAAQRDVGVLMGCDSLFLQCLAAGGAGTVSGPAQIFHKYFVGLYEAWIKGDMEKACLYQSYIVKTDRQLAGIPSIPAIKAMLKMLGIIDSDVCRKPLRALSKDEYKRLEHILEEYKKTIETEI